MDKTCKKEWQSRSAEPSWYFMCICIIDLRSVNIHTFQCYTPYRNMMVVNIYIGHRKSRGIALLCYYIHYEHNSYTFPYVNNWYQETWWPMKSTIGRLILANGLHYYLIYRRCDMKRFWVPLSKSRVEWIRRVEWIWGKSRVLCIVKVSEFIKRIESLWKCVYKTSGVYLSEEWSVFRNKQCIRGERGVDLEMWSICGERVECF